MNLKIDQEKCIGCGTCAALAPGAFIMNGDKAGVLPEITDSKDVIQTATEACPTQAIIMQ